MLAEIVITDGPQRGERLEIPGACLLRVAEGRILVAPEAGSAGAGEARVLVADGGGLAFEGPPGQGLLVNQRPVVGAHAAAHGDVVGLAGVAFVVYLPAPPPPPAPRADHRVISRKPMGDVASAVEELHQHRGHLAAFYRIVSEIHLNLDVDRLMVRMLEVLMGELAMAERGFVFLRTKDGQFKRGPTRFRGEPEESPRVSRGVLEEVLKGREAILSRNLLADSRFKSRESIVVERLTTAISAPFFDGPDVAGIVLLDSSTPGQPFQGPDLELVTAVAGQLSLALARRRLAALEEEKETLDRELVEAQSVQQFLLPSELPRILGCSLAVRSSFSQKLGGDYYDVFPLDAHRMALVVADVSGHSIGSALVMAMTRSIVRSHCLHLGSPSEVLVETNRVIRHDTRPGMFVTLFLAFLNTREMSLTFANAGHHWPILFEADRQRLRHLESGGFPLGLRNVTEYPTEKIYLKGGDFLVVYTDGVVEAKSLAEERFGRDGLIREVQGATGSPGAEALAATIFNAVSRHMGGRPPADDLSVLALAVDPAYDSLFFEFASTPEKADEAARLIAGYARDHGFLPARREAHLRLLLREASANAMVHGNRNHRGKKVSFYVRSDSQVMRVSVTDEGEGFAGNEALRRLKIDTKTHHGRGLFLMRKYADQVSYNERGNELVLDLTREGFAAEEPEPPPPLAP